MATKEVSIEEGVFVDSDGNRLVTLAALQAASSAAALLTRSGVKTANYVATANQLVPVDTTSGAVTVTLPNAPAAGTTVAVKHVIQGGTNAVTVACAGSDVFNKASGSTSMTLPLLAQAVLLSYDLSTHIWTILADDLPLSDLDARYGLLSGATFTGAVAVPDDPYNATTWDGSANVPTKNAVRDKIESLSSGAGASEELDVTLSPYLVVANDTSAPVLAQNVTGLAAALTAADAANKIVQLPPGTINLPWPTDPGPPSGVFSGQGISFTFSGNVHMRGAGRNLTKLAYPQTGAHPAYRTLMFNLTGTNKNKVFESIEFQGPVLMPSPFPSFRRYENFYRSQVIEHQTGGGSFFMRRCKMTGNWGLGVNGAGAAYVTGGSRTEYEDVDLFALDVVIGHFCDSAGPGYDYHYQVRDSVLRSHNITARNFITGCTFSGSTVTVTTAKPHRMVATDIVYFRSLPGGITSLTNGPYTILTAPTPTTFTFTQAGVGGVYTSLGQAEKITNIGFTVSGATVSGNTVTVTTSTAMDLFGTASGYVDTVVFPNGIPGLSGISTSGYTVQTVTDSTHFTITQAGVTGAYTSGGTVLYDWYIHGIGGYLAAHCSTMYENVLFTGGGREGTKNFGSSGLTATPGSYYKYVNCVFEGDCDALQTANLNAATSTELVNCTFNNNGTAVYIYQIGGVHKFVGCSFNQAREAINNASTGATSIIVADCEFGIPFDNTWAVAGNGTIFTQVDGTILRMSSCTMNMGFTNDIIKLVGAASRTYLTDVGFIAVSGRVNAQTITAAGYLRLLRTAWTGRHYFPFNMISGTTEIVLVENDFFNTDVDANFFFGFANAASKVRGYGNRWLNQTPAWSTSGTGPRISALEGQNSVVVTSAADTDLGRLWDTHHVAVGGATTVNNLWFGGSANANRVFGATKLTLIADDGNTTLSNSGGNIRLRAGANVTMLSGEVRQFIFDITGDVWREVSRNP